MIDKITKLLKQNDIESISGMDATFLYGETPNSPMHISSLIVIEGGLEFEDFKKIIAAKIHQVPKLRQRLVYVPMSIDYPYWVDDPDFNLDLHLNHIGLPKPGTWKQLRQMMARIISEPLERSRPLWSFTFIEGLDEVSQVPKGSVAILCKTHHVAIDGVSGAASLQIMFDLSPKKKPIPEPKPYQPKELPSTLSLLLNSTASFTESPLKLPGIFGDIVKASFKTGALSRLKYAKLPESSVKSPRSILNGTVSPAKTWGSAILSFQRVRTLSKISESTINDVLLSICAGALRKYLSEKNKLPELPLVAMVPISIRSKDESGSTGNKISQMLVQLATDIADPIERLQTIVAHTTRKKTYHKALGAKTMSKLASSIPFGIANQAARVYNRYNLSRLHNPLFNATISNVPGPPFPLYIHGHKVLALFGSAPIIDGMGLIIAIISYNGLITISPTSCQNIMPDIDLFARYIRDSANELEEALLKIQAEKKEEEQEEVSTPKELVASFQKILKKNASLLPGNDDVYQIHLTQSDTFLNLKLNKPAKVEEGEAKEVVSSFNIKDKFFKQILDKKLGWEAAVIQGRINSSGDAKKAEAFGQLMDQFLKS